MDRACYRRASPNPLDRYADYERSCLGLDRFHSDGVTDFRHVQLIRTCSEEVAEQAPSLFRRGVLCRLLVYLGGTRGWCTYQLRKLIALVRRVQEARSWP